MRRWKNHISKLNRNEHHNQYLQRSWNKYTSVNFSFGLIEICEENDLHYLEQWHLDHWSNIFNISIISNSPMKGRRHTPETRAKISRSLQGNTYTLGYKATKETRKKLSIARKGKPQVGGVKHHSEETKAKISATGKAKFRLYQYIVNSPDGNEYLIDNLTQFCQENELSRTCMFRVLYGQQEHHSGYTVRYVTSRLIGD